MTLFDRYLIWAVLCFVFALIYIHFLMKQTEGKKKLAFPQKLLYSLFIAIIVPLIILGVFKLFGVHIFG